jgi:putative acyl-CoA dehydrogenase
MPRLYREAPLNSIWEGSGNINALDVLRIVRKQPEALAAWHDELVPTFGDPRIAAEAQLLRRELAGDDGAEARARSLSERMALLWQGALLVRHAPNYISDAFVESRIDGRRGQVLGTLPHGTRLRAIVDRAAPVLSRAAYT